MPELRKGSNIAQRLVVYAGQTLRLLKRFPKKDPAAQIIAKQLGRSSTSVGANYEEARAAESAADFIHKLSVSLKELRESEYWLRLVLETELVDQDLGPLLRETHELAAILRASIKTARRNLKDSRRENRGGNEECDDEGREDETAGS